MSAVPNNYDSNEMARELGEISARLDRYDEDRLVLRQIANSVSNMSSRLDVIAREAEIRRDEVRSFKDQCLANVQEIKKECLDKLERINALERWASHMKGGLAILSLMFMAVAGAIAVHWDWKH